MTHAILQARMSSSRLPGKVLKQILGRPMLDLLIERLRRCRKIDRIIVATSARPDDAAIVDLCKRLGVDVFAGDLENVLDRFYQTARRYGAEHIVRLTGDCPLNDPHLIDALVEFYFRQGCDYASNSRPPTLPDGLDAEIFRFQVLKQAWREARDPYHLEHVTPFIVSQPERFDLANYSYKENYSHLRWTVDEPEDFQFVEQVYEALYPVNPCFGMMDVFALLKQRPDIRRINSHHRGVRRYENILKPDA